MKQPKNPFHPGEILLEEFLAPGGLTQTGSGNEPQKSRLMGSR